MDSNIKPMRTAATPIMSDLQIKLVRDIDQNAPYSKLFDIVKEMVDDTARQSTVNMTAAIKTFKDDEAEMEVLFHSIPRCVLRSIAMRMLAFDFWHKAASPRKDWLYKEDGPGAYICSISVIGRKGNAWTGAENRKLVGALGEYALAVDAVERRDKGDGYGNSHFSDTEQEALEQAMTIDGLYLFKKVQHDTQNYYMPHFASTRGQDKSHNIHAMIAALKKRNRQDWDDEVECLQSPFLVGNWNDTEKREQSHRTISTLRQPAKTWGLLLSTLKHLGLEVEETFVPVCKAWELEHINLAEILLTVIGGSLVSVDGLNVHPPGTKSVKNPPEARAFEENKYHVLGANTWCGENMEQSIAARPAVAKVNDMLARLEVLPSMDELWALAHKEEDLRNDVIRLQFNLDVATTRRMKQLDEVEEALKRDEMKDQERAKLKEVWEKAIPIATEVGRQVQAAREKKHQEWNSEEDYEENEEGHGEYDDKEEVDEEDGDDDEEDIEEV
jgi:hypothetical protein